MEPWFGDEEAEAVYAYMRSGGWVTEFAKTREFERLIAGYTGTKYCSVTTNGTTALFLALHASGITAGDEVIVPDYTMVASANAAALTGAEVVLADIEEETLCLDFKSLEAVATEKTKAIVLVSINGRYPLSLDNILAFARERGIKVIEDAAQSLGSFRGGKHAGLFGDVGCLSFSSQKIISTGQGGAVITNDQKIMERVLKLRDFGREKSGEDHYLTMGWNFKFTDLQAVVGIEQMQKLAWRVERKKEIYKFYREHLQGISGISFIPTDLDQVCPWFIDILMESRREDLMAFLKDHDIGSRPFYPALHATAVYNRKESHPVAERIARQGLWLPSASQLRDEQIAKICESIKEFFKSD